MKMKFFGLALALGAMLATAQAGEKNGKSACCASTQAKGTTCTAKSTARATKSGCCAQETSTKAAANPFPVKGAILLMQFARK